MIVHLNFPECNDNAFDQTLNNLNLYDSLHKCDTMNVLE